MDLNNRADIVFLNGSVLTVDKQENVAEALAVKENKIVFVGTSADAQSFTGGETKVIDLNGRSLVPGFIDSHLHMALKGANELAIDCRYPNVKNIEDIKRLIKETAEKTPKGKWIRGWGYDQSKLEEKRHPNRWDLDEVAPDNPVMISRVCAHMSTHNSISIELAGIEDDPLALDGGIIDRINGVATGVMKENAHMNMMKVAALNIDEIVEGLDIADKKLISEGITSVHDSGGYGKVQMKAFQKAVEKNKLSVRLYTMIFAFVDNIQFVNDYIDMGIYTNFGNEKFKLGPIKIMIDGSSSGPTAATFEPYKSRKDDCGILSMTQEQVDDIVMRAHLAGYQVTAHTIGDKAVTMMVDAIDKALTANPKKDHRHRIEHCCMVNDELINRIKALGIIPIPQPIFLYEFGDGYMVNYGEERANRMFTCKTFINEGIIAAGSSDCPVTFSDPLLGMHLAVNRVTQTGQAISQNERVTVKEALRMHTYNGAYASFEENIKGSLEIGKLADMVVLSDSLLKIPSDRIKDIKVDMTVIDGNIVYER